MIGLVGERLTRSIIRNRKMNPKPDYWKNSDIQMTKQYTPSLILIQIVYNGYCSWNQDYVKFEFSRYDCFETIEHVAAKQVQQSMICGNVKMIFCILKYGFYMVLKKGKGKLKDPNPIY